MKALSPEQAKKWCDENRVYLPHSVSHDGRARPSLPVGSLPVKFRIRSDAGARICDCRSYFVPLRDQDILIWFDDWSVWPSGEFTPMFERFRQGLGGTGTLAEYPAYLFSPGEFDDALSSFIFAALFLWDCHVITQKHGYCLFISHDEWGLAKFPPAQFE